MGSIIDKILSLFDPNEEITFPNLPCVVFNRRKVDIWNTVLFIPLVSFYIGTLNISSALQIFLWILILIIAVVAYKIYRRRIIETYLTSTNIRIKFGNGLKRNFPLEKYAFYISIWNEKGSMKSYTYRISLIECGKLKNSITINTFIPLKWRVLRPADLSKFVEHIQQQLPQKLEVIFENKKVADEYELKDFIR